MTRLERFAIESVSIGDGLKWGEQCSEGMKTDPTMFLAWTAAELVMLMSKKSCTRGMNRLGFVKLTFW